MLQKVYDEELLKIYSPRKKKVEIQNTKLQNYRNNNNTITQSINTQDKIPKNIKTKISLQETINQQLENIKNTKIQKNEKESNKNILTGTARRRTMNNQLQKQDLYKPLKHRRHGEDTVDKLKSNITNTISIRGMPYQNNTQIYEDENEDEDTYQDEDKYDENEYENKYIKQYDKKNIKDTASINSKQKEKDNDMNTINYNMYKSKESNNTKTPCYYGINCTRADCFFLHPPERVIQNTQKYYDENDANTTTVDNEQTQMSQQNVLCRFDTRCTRRDRCKYMHTYPTSFPYESINQQDITITPTPIQTPSTTSTSTNLRNKLCRYGDLCTNINCRFIHPNGMSKRKCRYDTTCTRPDCVFEHSTE